MDLSLGGTTTKRKLSGSDSEAVPGTHHGFRARVFEKYYGPYQAPCPNAVAAFDGGHGYQTP